MAWETWYVLEDGTYTDPREVTHDDSGVLRNKAGVAVAMKGGVPHSRGVDADEERAKATATAAAVKEAPQKAPEARQSPTHQRRDMVAEESARPYKTR